VIFYANYGFVSNLFTLVCVAIFEIVRCNSKDIMADYGAKARNTKGGTRG
jgi:hypothetical protein